MGRDSIRNGGNLPVENSPLLTVRILPTSTESEYNPLEGTLGLPFTRYPQTSFSKEEKKRARCPRYRNAGHH